MTTVSRIPTDEEVAALRRRDLEQLYMAVHDGSVGEDGLAHDANVPWHWLGLLAVIATLLATAAIVVAVL